MEDFLKCLYYITGNIYIPQKVNISGIKILHISDTPYAIFDRIIKMVRKIQPDIIIHTGDISDDIKLELMPEFIEKYKKQAGYLISELERYSKDKLILVPGNHDNIKELKLSPKTTVVEEGNTIVLYGLKIGLAHDVERLPPNCDFYLYGHCRTCDHKAEYLNGINSINIITIPEKKVYKISYPFGTDDYRYKRKKIGI